MDHAPINGTMKRPRTVLMEAFESAPMLAPPTLAIADHANHAAATVEVCQAEFDECLRSLQYTVSDFADYRPEIDPYERRLRDHEHFLGHFRRECVRQGFRLHRSPEGCRSFADWLHVRLCLLHGDTEGAWERQVRIERKLVELLSHASAKISGPLATLLREHRALLLKDVVKTGGARSATLEPSA